ncbi:5-amino-6-(5-phospho-D-ribitylamino)uracil phosphatase [Spiroplasma chinense]|uniref:5-amino-6-(5-phospho-D-ribitylamino)uracil phosphatase n=1 Tax=Spiroplasma chinense TaxID=216932 RepID=A0A5B9Y6L6_9MOLU|nr:Cof-type HAD-IIB family hydrolase [Spiroplasma chinense]QEH62339.1 5-amino-6-(5-phospho-D-ribitylamino)uracil phosphatase [Spiroplasma chinense]
MKLQHLDKKRLILIDLDGTALKANGEEIHQKTKEVLIKAREDGHHVCIITGRPHRASIRFYKELGLTTLLTNFDGAHIHDPLKRRFKRIVLPISEDIVQGIIHNPIIKDACQNILIENYNKAVVSKKDEFIEKFFHLDDVEDDDYFISNVYEAWEGPSTNVVLFLKDDKQKDEIFRQLEKFKNSIKIQSGNVYGNMSQEAVSMITLTNKIVNKGFVSDILAQYYNTDIRDVIAFGDQMNDYEMIKRVGYGVAMQNGSDDLKSVAAGITQLSNDEGGLGYYLEALLEGKEV